MQCFILVASILVLVALILMVTVVALNAFPSHPPGLLSRVRQQLLRSVPPCLQLDSPGADHSGQWIVLMCAFQDEFNLLLPLLHTRKGPELLAGLLMSTGRSDETSLKVAIIMSGISMPNAGNPEFPPPLGGRYLFSNTDVASLC
jgi:hypothetical protein